MKLDKRATAIASGLFWGGGVLAVEIVNRVTPDFGAGFLRTIASFYPGYKGGRSARQIALGATYAFIDGATSGFLFALLYNRLADRAQTAATRQQLPKAG